MPERFVRLSIKTRVGATHGFTESGGVYIGLTTPRATGCTLAVSGSSNAETVLVAYVSSMEPACTARAYTESGGVYTQLDDQSATGAAHMLRHRDSSAK